MNTRLTLIPIGREGSIRGCTVALADITREVIQGTVSMYEPLGFEEPWICYLAMVNGVVAGTCGFKGPPSDGRVEIAYFTFPEFEGRGHATAMAAELIRIAQGSVSRPTVAAQTLPQPNASHRILEKLGFQHTQTIQHPEDGTVWEWRLQAES